MMPPDRFVHIAFGRLPHTTRSTTMMTLRTVHRSLACLAACAVALGAGCTSYQGQKTGRVDPAETTEAEMKSGKMYIADLYDASGRVAEALMKDLERLAQTDLKQGDQAYLSTLVYGDIANKTSTMPTTDFEVVRERVRDMLLNSSEFRKNFRVVENRGRYEDLRARELGAGAGDRKINENFAYFLNGNAFSLDRPETRGFYLNFQLMRASDGEIIFSKRYEQTYK